MSETLRRELELRAEIDLRLHLLENLIGTGSRSEIDRLIDAATGFDSKRHNQAVELLTELADLFGQAEEAGIADAEGLADRCRHDIDTLKAAQEPAP